MSHVHKSRPPCVGVSGVRPKGSLAVGKSQAAHDERPLPPLNFHNSTKYFQVRSVSQSTRSWRGPFQVKGEWQTRPAWDQRHHISETPVDLDQHYRRLEVLLRRQQEIQRKQSQKLSSSNNMSQRLPDLQEEINAMTGEPHVPASIRKQQKSLSARCNRSKLHDDGELGTTQLPRHFASANAANKKLHQEDRRLKDMQNVSEEPSAQKCQAPVQATRKEEFNRVSSTSSKVQASQPSNLTKSDVADKTLVSSAESLKQEEKSTVRSLPPLVKPAWTTELKSSQEEQASSTAEIKDKSSLNVPKEPGLTSMEKITSFESSSTSERETGKKSGLSQGKPIVTPAKRDPQESAGGIASAVEKQSTPSAKAANPQPPSSPTLAVKAGNQQPPTSSPTPAAKAVKQQPPSSVPATVMNQQSTTVLPGRAFAALQKKVDTVSDESPASKKKAIDKMVNELTCKGCLVPFSQEEKDILFSFFDLHDDDGSNSLSLAELVCVAVDVVPPPVEGSEDAQNFERLMRDADSDGTGELNFEEFIHFLANYYQSVYARLFVENDIDKSGTITKFELTGLMVKVKDLGFKARGEDIAEMFQNIDMGGDGILDWEEFCEFMRGYRKLEFDLLKVSAGFTSKELLYLQSIFSQADADGSGHLNIKEVLDLLEARLTSTGFDTQEEVNKIAKLFSRMDKDKSMTLDQMEFLRLLRVWSNNKDGKQDILKVLGQDSAGEVGSKKRATEKRATETFGLDVDEAEAEEFEKQALQLRDLAVQQEIEDGILAGHNNMTNQEVRILRESFEFCDADGSGRIDNEELIIILKTLGCVATTAPQKKAFTETLKQDEFIGSLEFVALVRFLAAYYEACVDEVLQSMKEDSHEDEEHKGVVVVEKLVGALYQLGQVLSKDAAVALLVKVGGDRECKVVGKSTLLKMLHAVRLEKLITWRQTCGFSESQLAVIKHAFSEHSDDQNGMNRGPPVLNALKLLNLVPPPEKRQNLIRALLRIDRQGNGTITLDDFLLLARHLENERLHKRTEEEKEKAKKAGLNAEAIEQFREVFNACDPDFENKVNNLVIRQCLIDLGIVKTYKQKQLLKALIEEVTGSDEAGVEFSQFLEILHKLESQGVC